MNCRRVSNLISAYIDGELTGVEMLEIRRHLKDCRACTLQYESLRYVKNTLSRLAYAQPRPGLADRISAQLDLVEIPGYQKIWNRLLAFGRAHITPVAVGCAALGAVFVFLVSQPAPSNYSLVTIPTATEDPSNGRRPLEAQSPFMVISKQPEQARPFIPPAQPEETPGSGLFTLASFR